MIVTELGEGLVRLTPSVKGNKIEEIRTGRKHSVVVCNEDNVGNFQEVENG